MTSKDQKLIATRSAVEIATQLAEKGTLQEAARSIDQSNTRDAFAASGAITDVMRIAAGALPASLADVMRKASPYSDSLTDAFKQMNTIDQLRKIGLAQTSAFPFNSPNSRQSGIHGHSKSESVAIKSTNDIGAAVKKARKTKGLTQQQFADLAGVGRRFLSELEAGKPTCEIGRVLKVAAAAGLHLMIAPAGRPDE
jgi:y4mF family transcriptional regulator